MLNGGGTERACSSAVRTEVPNGWCGLLTASLRWLCLGQAQVSPYSGWELLERAWPEVAHIVNLVTLEQRRDAAAVGRGCRDMQHQLAVPERLVVDRQSVPVVAELLEGSHDAGAQSVVAAVRVQDACSLLTAQDFHRRDVDSGRCEAASSGRCSRAGRCCRSCALVGLEERLPSLPAVGAGRPRRKRRVHQLGRAGMLWGGGRWARRSDRLDAGLGAAGAEDERDGEQCGGDDRPQQQQGLLSAQAR